MMPRPLRATCFPYTTLFRSKPSIQLSFAAALRLSGQDREARRLLDSVSIATPEVAAQRLFDIGEMQRASNHEDRKSTRLNSSHPSISYAVFCLKKKNKPLTS